MIGLVLATSLSAKAIEATRITLWATADGNRDPILVQYPQDNDEGVIENGNFVIGIRDDWPPDEPTLIGDGLNESTSWNFDFNPNPNFPNILRTGSLVSAILTLKLEFRSSRAANDTVSLVRLQA